MDVSAGLSEALRSDPQRIALEFEAQVFACEQIETIGARIRSCLDAAQVASDAPVALVARNRPAAAIAMLGLVEAGRTVSNIYAFQSSAMIASDLAKGRYQAIVAESSDWTGDLIAAARACGSVGIGIDLDAAEPVYFVDGLERSGPGPFHPPLADAGIEVLSSGTTGPPKRVGISNRILARAVQSIAKGGVIDGALAPDIVLWPISGIGGACCLIGDFVLKRRIVLLEKFDLNRLIDALRRHAVPAFNAPPAVLRAILDADISREEIGSLRYVFGGSAPLPPDLQQAFEQRYGIPVIWAYGATEFCGTLTSWTPDLHREFGTLKRGSIGRALPGTELRIVDPHTGQPLPVGEIGLIEGRAAELGPEWIRTTDMAYVDEDGFYFHCGRSDGAIVRGGFKIVPDRIDDALREHPAILDAATVGVPDPRLGEVPVAAVEVARGHTAPTSEELTRFLRERVAAPQIPVRFLVVERLPRTTSLKPAIAEVRALFTDAT